MNARWYRICVTYGSLVWLNMLFLVASLGVVTIPAALVALHEQTHRMAKGAGAPGWRGFVGSLRRLGARATAVLLVFALPVMVAGAVIETSPSAFAAGISLVVGMIAAMFLSIAPYVVTVGARNVRICVVNVVAAVVLRPGVAIASMTCWALCAAAIAWLPVGFAFALYAVAVSLPAYLTCVVASRPRATSRTTPRRIAAERVLSPVSNPGRDGVLVP